jgi:sugar fermentation stimulation protein A
MKLFSADAWASFQTRPNRFIITAETDQGIVRAHCPNPGRLEEILHPGRKLILEKAQGRERKTSYSLVAAEYKRKIIPLHSVKANRIAEELIIPRLFPGSMEITSEYTVGHSRFDFLVRTGKERHLIEVKACTLVEEGTAMFPDAPSIRARRHITELAVLTGGSTQGHVIFIIMHHDAERFIPNLHTDPDFALELRRVSKHLCLHAVSARCSADGHITLVNTSLPIEFSPLELVEQNRGCYLIILEIRQDCRVEVGALGGVIFKKGWYVYAGSAMKNLTQRLARHGRKRKNFHWHIDYLLAYAEKVKSYPVYSYRNLECIMAEGIGKIADDSVRGFGSSDCACGSHLHFFQENPMKREVFTDILFGCRHNLAFEK